ncbi:ABC-F family ATP-binding cassette domain-containing protein [Cellulomonas sp. NPDC089187]|uniref:ABC-F family ATP-binding cassette domain-containing protein n=1 Tax=Cellulomonas sp. NPDC089187 TaxID=3154970 RepID=UPI0034472B94
MSLQSSTPVLRATGLSRAYGDRRVLTDLSFAVDPGHRLGLVGENGIGKSTLLRLLAGVEEPDTGEVQRPADLAYLAQEPPFGADASIDDVIGAALSEVRAVAADLEAAALALAEGTEEAATRYDLALAHAEAAEVWDADGRAQRVLAGIGLGELDPTRVSGSLSGGQRSRLALAAVLVRRPRAVLLDEPTNHLDDDAAEFLATALAELPGAVVLASHDRVFLDEVVTEILDLDPGLDGPRVVGGTYTDFREAKRIAREQWQQRWLAEREELSALRSSVAPDGKARQVVHGRAMKDRNKMSYGRHGDFVQQQVGRRVRNAQRRLDDLEREQVRRPPRELRFAAPLTAATRREGTLISVRDVVVPGRVSIPALDVHADTALLVTGPNGSGKSTLLHVLAGDLVPTIGTAWRAKGATVALLEQDVGLADDDRTPRAVYDLVTARFSDPVPLQELGLVAPRDLDRPLRELSVGQRRRVVLALLVAQTPDVLLLDEPTNHISLALADELGDALRSAPGAVVVASHDRWLRRGWHGDELTLMPTLNA